MSKIDEESLRRIANRMEEAAETAKRAAESMSESVQRMSVMFEDGYGGNALKLIELLEATAQNVRVNRES